MSTSDEDNLAGASEGTSDPEATASNASGSDVTPETPDSAATADAGAGPEAGAASEAAAAEDDALAEQALAAAGQDETQAGDASDADAAPVFLGQSDEEAEEAEAGDVPPRQPLGEPVGEEAEVGGDGGEDESDDEDDEDDGEPDEDEDEDDEDEDDEDDEDDEVEDEVEADEAPAGAAPVAREKRRRRLRRPGSGEKEAKTPKDESKKPAAAPRRRRTTRQPGDPVPVVRAHAKYVRSSARKARLVCDNIRGKSVEDARAILAHTPRAVARDWSKLLESAIANAEHNHELVGEDLYVKVVHADEGPTIKRHRPRAQGRATKIRKRTTHLTILLTPKD